MILILRIEIQKYVCFCDYFLLISVPFSGTCDFLRINTSILLVLRDDFHIALSMIP